MPIQPRSVANLCSASSSWTLPWPSEFLWQIVSTLWTLSPYLPEGGRVLVVPTYFARRTQVSKTWLLPLSLPQELAEACGVSQQGRFFLVPSEGLEFPAWVTRSPHQPGVVW